ncbi:MAG: hypothetical protein EZS28_049913, partial [Streblomastix strix]
MTPNNRLSQTVNQLHIKTQNNKDQRNISSDRETNFLRIQFRESSLFLIPIDSAKIRGVKTQDWTGMMASPLEALKELYCWIKKIQENKKQQIYDNSTCSSGSKYFTTRVGATLELDSGEVPVAHGVLLSYQIHWTSNGKELHAIHIGILAFTRVCKKLQITNLLVKSDNSTTIFDLRRLRAKETLAPAV